MASKHIFHIGDRVEWSAGSGSTTGIVKEYITEDRKVDGNQVSASKDDPRYLVENHNIGNMTGHKPETLSHSSSQSEGGSDTDLSDVASLRVSGPVEYVSREDDRDREEEVDFSN